jgi:hypothetical protein
MVRFEPSARHVDCEPLRGCVLHGAAPSVGFEPEVAHVVDVDVPQHARRLSGREGTRRLQLAPCDAPQHTLHEAAVGATLRAAAARQRHGHGDRVGEAAPLGLLDLAQRDAQRAIAVRRRV